MSKLNVLAIVFFMVFSALPITQGTSDTGADKNTIEFSSSLCLQNDVVWDVGDYWTYVTALLIEYAEEAFSVTADCGLTDLQFTVTSLTNGLYTLDIEGEVFTVVDISVQNPQLNITVEVIRTSLTGFTSINQSDLGIKEMEVHIHGFLIASIEPIPIPFDITMTIDFLPVLPFLQFPLQVGSEWDVLYTLVTINIGEDFFAFLEKIVNLVKKLVPPDIAEMLDLYFELVKNSFPFELNIGGSSVECVDFSNLTVQAGTYESYQLEFIMANLFFAPVASNFVKAFATDGNLFTLSVDLTSTSYKNLVAPLKPETPSGRARGRINKAYTYTTSAEDPNNNKVAYGWDWNGDLMVDEWTDFYDEGKQVHTTHKWTDKNSYNIRVRAKNENGIESEWSDPLAVSMPYEYQTLWELIIEWILQLFKNTIS